MPWNVSSTPSSSCLRKPSNQWWAGVDDALAHKRLEENFIVTTSISYQWTLWSLPLKSVALCPFSERCPWFFNNFLNVGFQDRFAREHISVVGSNYPNHLLIIHYFVYTMLAVWLVFPSLVCGLWAGSRITSGCWSLCKAEPTAWHTLMLSSQPQSQGAHLKINQFAIKVFILYYLKQNKTAALLVTAYARQLQFYMWFLTGILPYIRPCSSTNDAEAIIAGP